MNSFKGDFEGSPDLGTSSGTWRAVHLAETLSSKDSHARTRVRLLIGIPVLIVLMLTLMAGVLYQIAEVRLQNARVGTGATAIEDFFRDWLLVLLVFDLAGAFVGYLIAASITAPIRDLIRISEKIASGDFSRKARVTRSDEVGQLGDSFNQMIESLNNYITIRNRFVLESFSGGLLTLDVNGTITAMNSAAEDLLDLDAAQALGKPVDAVLGQPGTRPLLSAIQETLWKKQPIVSRKLEIRSDSHVASLSLNTSTMRDREGNMFGLIVNFRDLDEWQRFHEHLNRADRLATIGTFATGLAHEIRNPLGAIKATAQLLAEDVKSNPNALEYTQIIVKEVNRLDGLVREVQEFSSPTGAVTKPTDVNRFVRDTLYIARHSPKLPQPLGIPFEEKYDPIPTAMLAPDKLRQALLNLMINAFQAAHPDGSVSVSTKFEGEDRLPIQISVHNTGSSIPAGNLNRIFEPFFTTKESGSGLGLSIAYQIVNYHGGEIEPLSDADSATFVVKLPFQESEQESYS